MLDAVCAELDAARAKSGFWVREFYYKDVRLRKTSDESPEQYDAYDDEGNKIGYFRLRHGYFQASIGEWPAYVVYEADTDGHNKFTDAERGGHLRGAIDALLAKLP